MSANKQLIKWFKAEQRVLPWRVDRSPYAVWISEMMLQQTQVAVVIPYFERWMKLFPSIQHLAAAELDDVIKAWEGLGYYSRARYLHQGSQYIVKEFNGVFPNNSEDLEQVKGLGPYTRGAILSFAFHQRVAAVDGNVIRVLARYFCIKDDVAKPKTVESIRKRALEFLPEDESWVVNEALIELGATICTKSPNCSRCPIKSSCQAHIKGMAAELPVKTKKTKVELLYRSVAIIKWKNYWLLQRGEKGAIMSDLHEFPYFETAEAGMQASELQAHIVQQFGCRVDVEVELDCVQQSFTRYRVRLNPVAFTCKESKLPKVSKPYLWVHEGDMEKLAFSSGHRKILSIVSTTRNLRDPAI